MAEKKQNTTKKSTAKKNSVIQSYKFIKGNSILNGIEDEFSFTADEYNLMYLFFVTYSMCGNQSGKKRTIEDYGWKSKNNSNATYQNTGLKDKLVEILDLCDNDNFIFTEENNLKEKFNEVNLNDGSPTDFTTERAVIGKTTTESNNFFKLFYRIRDGLAHGRFVLRYGENEERMFVMQDNDRNNVTARIIIKVETLIKYIKAVDKNNILSDEFKDDVDMAS